MTEIEPTDSSTGRPRLFVCAAFVVGATTLSPGFLRRQDPWHHDRSSRFVYRTIVYLVGVGERCRPSLSDCVVARQHIRIPARIGLPFLAARKDAGRMRKDQCVAFRPHL